MSSVVGRRRQVTYGGRHRRPPLNATWSTWSLNISSDDEESTEPTTKANTDTKPAMRKAVSLRDFEPSEDPFAFVIEDEEAEGPNGMDLEDLQSPPPARRKEKPLRMPPLPTIPSRPDSQPTPPSRSNSQPLPSPSRKKNEKGPSLTRTDATNPVSVKVNEANSRDTAQVAKELDSKLASIVRPSGGKNDTIGVQAEKRPATDDHYDLISSPSKRRLFNRTEKVPAAKATIAEEIDPFDFQSSPPSKKTPTSIKRVPSQTNTAIPLSPGSRANRTKKPPAFRASKSFDATVSTSEANHGEPDSPMTPRRGRISRMQSADGKSPASSLCRSVSSFSDSALLSLKSPAGSMDMDLDTPESPSVRKPSRLNAPRRAHTQQPKTILDDLDDLFAPLSNGGEAENVRCSSPSPEAKGRSGTSDATDISSPKARGRVGRMKSLGRGPESPSTRRLASFSMDAEDVFFSQENGTVAGVGLSTATASATISRITASDSDTAGNRQTQPAESDEVNMFFASCRMAASRPPLYPSRREVVDVTESPMAPMIFNPISTEPPTPMVRHAVGVTYARTRSYVETEEDLYAPKYVSELQRRREEGLESSDEEEDGGRHVKSIHELREAGEAKRFADEMEYILGGLVESESLGVKRASCSELCKKILSGKFMMKVRAHGFLSRFYESVHLADDAILLTMVTFILCALLQDKRNLEYLVREEDLVDLLTRASRLSPDPLSGGLKSKYEKRLMVEIKDVFQGARFLREFTGEIKLRYIALRCISEIATAKPPNSPYIQNQLRASGALDVVLEMLLAEVEKMNRLLDGESVLGGLLSAYETIKSNMEMSLRCLRVLEFATLACRPNVAYIVERTGLVEGLMKIVAWSSAIARAQENGARTASRFLHETLSLLLNLSHDHDGCSELIGESDWFSSVVRCAVVPNNLSSEAPSAPAEPMDLEFKQEEKKPPDVQDEGELEGAPNNSEDFGNFSVMILGVGLLENVLHTNARNRERIRNIELCLRCPGTGTCLRSCCCDERQSAVACVADLVNDRLAMEMEDANHAVLTGQTTMLLGFIIKSHPSNRSLALTRMTKHQMSFSAVIEMMENFSRLYEVMERGAGGGNGFDMYGVRETSQAVAELVEVFKG